jgi:hypothetical protein
MQKRLLLSLIVWFTMTTVAVAADGEPQPIIFNMKYFIDSGNMVHVEGTLTGDRIGYKNNRSAITCYQDQPNCLSTHIYAQGLQVFSIGPPASYAVRLWTAARIVADSEVPCGDPPSERLKQEWQTTQSDTWIIDRERQTAELIEHPCLGAKTYHWTIEDPLFWKKTKDSAAQ